MFITFHEIIFESLTLWA